MPNGNPHSGISAVLVEFFAVLVEKSAVLAENSVLLPYSIPSHELYVVNNDTAHLLIQLFHQFGSLHLQFCTQSCRTQMHHQNLVTNGQITRILSHHFSCHFGPCRNEPMLIERRFESFLTQIMMDELGDGLCFAAFHVLL